MKKLSFLFLIVLATVMTLFAQPPQAMKYKAIAKDQWGLPLPRKTISLRFTIFQGSGNGTIVYQETHRTTTTLVGLMDVNIGEGTPQTGNFSAIDWGAADFYIKVELDPRGGTNYILQDESEQLLSVPYALYAGNVQSNDDADADPENEMISDIYLSGTTLYIVEGGRTTLVNLSDLQDGTEDADADATNELQHLSVSDHELTISNGNTVALPDNVDDADADPENEIQDLQLNDNILTITKNGTATEIDLSPYLDDTDTHLTEAEVDAMVGNNGYLTGVTWADIPDVPADLADGDDNTQLTEAEVDAMVANNGYLTAEADGDATNELQDISLNDHSLSITDGSTVVLPDNVDDADHDPNNEIQVLSLDGNMLSLTTNGIPIQIDLAPYLDNTDNQFLLLTGHQLTITNGNMIQLPDSVNDADHDPLNEMQTLALNGTDLSITGGNTVDLSVVQDGVTDGSETKILAGNNVTISGEGTEENPYVINSAEGGSAIPGNNPGDMMYWNGSAWAVLPVGQNGQILSIIDGIPRWAGETSTLVVSTSIIINIETTLAIGGGNIICDDCGVSVMTRGVCWSSDNVYPTIEVNKTDDGVGTGTFASLLSGLSPNTKYFVRAYAVCPTDTIYGESIFFATKGAEGTLTDIEGNTYKTIEIGTQIWMAENLRTTKYNDGTEIPLIIDQSKWISYSVGPGYCWYDNSESNKTVYGALYNWYALSTTTNGDHNICPVGWHISSAEDWQKLSSFLSVNDGGKLKEAGTIHWNTPNKGATNETGFTALPGGLRDINGNFIQIENEGTWWTTLAYSIDVAISLSMFYYEDYVYSHRERKTIGYSARCVRD